MPLSSNIDVITTTMHLLRQLSNPADDLKRLFDA